MMIADGEEVRPAQASGAKGKFEARQPSPTPNVLIHHITHFWLVEKEKLR